MKKFSLLLILLVPALYQSCSNNKLHVDEKPVVKNIIFFIGDGMGTTQVYAAMLASEEKLNMEKAPVSGMATTFSANSKITDSAASGTALATGSKTKNGMIGQDSTGNELESVLKIAEREGLATGLVSTSAITHATPASFIANEPSRNNYEAIAADFMKTDIDVFIGGGYNHFAVRQDSLNYTDSLVNKGYTVVRSLEEMKASSADKLAGLIYDEHGPSIIDGRGNMLPEATDKALQILSANEKGFFLMVEASQIDWGGHANDGDYVLQETLDLDRALGVALEFQKNHPNTLVVVTADHETGGLTLTSGEGYTGEPGMEFSTPGHTAVLVPVFAYGPGAEFFTGVFDNTEFITKFLQLYSFPE